MSVFSLVILSSIVAAVCAAPASSAHSLSSFSLRNTALSRRASVNYTENYLADGASVIFLPNETTGTFTVNYNTSEDFVVGLGWQPGDSM
jgi:endo-1,4-beta-xylanase